MCKKRKKPVKISGNGSFVVFNVVLLLILAGSIVFSVADVVFGIITWPNNYVEVIGVSTQIITAVASLVVSIVGIAISLQNEEFFWCQNHKAVFFASNEALLYRSNYPNVNFIVHH